MSFSRKPFFPLFIALLCFVLLPFTPLAGQEVTPNQSSLKLAPKNSAFYWSVSNVRAQIDRVWKSNAIQKVVKYLDEEGVVPEQLKEDFLEGIIESIARESGVDEDEIYDWMDKQENKDLLALITDALSSEMYMFANDDYCDLMGAYVDMYKRMSNMMFEVMLSGDIEVSQEMMKTMLPKVLSVKQVEKMKVPDIVVGFQITNEKRAIEQIKRLEALIRTALDDADAKPWADRLKWQKIGDGNYLTMTAKGEDIPWKVVREEVVPEAKDVIDYYKDALSKKTMAVAIGVYKNNLILTVGDDLTHLKNFASGESLLSHPKFAKVRKVASKRSAFTMYMSQRMADNSYTWSEYLQQQFTTTVAMFVGFSTLSDRDEDEKGDKFTKRIRADLKELAKDVETLTPKAGAFLSHSFMTSTGYAGFSQNWAENKSHDGSKQLDILQNVGSDPIAVFAARKPYRPQDYEIFAKWGNKILGYISEMGGEDLVGMESDEFQAVYEKVKGMMLKIHNSIKDHWLPAFKDGQSALVIDASLKSKQFHPMMPAAKQELTLQQPVLLFGVSDRDLVKKGASTFIEVANEATTLVMKTFNEDAPPFEIPPAKVEKAGDAEYYYYSLKDYLGGEDDSLGATAGLSKNRLVLTLNRDTAKQCMAKSSVKYNSFVNEYVGKKISRFNYLDWNKLMVVWEGWFEYLIDQADEQGMIDESFEEFIPAIELAMDVIGCLQNISSVSFVENESVVTMYEWKFKDIPK